jgi:hypothetical protein
MHRGHRARLYPTAEQAATLRRWSGAARFLWNLARDQRRWFPGRAIGRVSQCLDLTELRREVDWQPPDEGGVPLYRLRAPGPR